MIHRIQLLPGQTLREVRPQLAGHSKTSHSKATPSGSFSSNHVSAASGGGEDLDVLGVANLFAGVDVDKDGHLDSLS
jgi:hypothetical protein